MESNSTRAYLSCIVLAVAATTVSLTTLAQQKKELVFDIFHGQNPRNAEVFNGLLPPDGNAMVTVTQGEINEEILKGKEALILFSPTKPLSDSEKTAIGNYLKSGGSLLLIFDEERRTPLQLVGVNDIITPFGMSLTDDAPVRHNCGAIAEKSAICSERRELPYSGGRSVKGGTVISKVNDDGTYVHSAYTTLPGNGKLFVMSDGMTGLLLGGTDGVRFSGTGPSDSKYWGKDARIFMGEVFAFLLKGE